MPTTSVQLPSATPGSPIYVAAEQQGGVFTFHSVPEVGGAAVAVGNPLPVAPVVGGAPVSSANPSPVADATVGTVADAAWGGSGSGTLVALLKALWARWGGGLPLLDAGGSNKAAINAQGALSVTARNGLTITQTVVTLAANTDALLIAPNANRKYLGLCNIGAANVSLAFNGAAVVNAGWPLSPAATAGLQGGAMVWEGSGVSTDAIHGIAPSGTSVVVWEGV